MFGKSKPQVLIIGAGPVGLFTALCLARRGVEVRVVEEEWRQTAHSYALALHPDSLRLLDEIGLANPVLEEAYRVQQVGLFDHTGERVRMQVSDLSEEFPFVAVLRQDRLEGLLLAALREAGVRVEWNHRLARIEPGEEFVQVAVDKLVKESSGYGVAHTEWTVQSTRETEVPFVVGADGHGSLVRQALDIPFDSVGEPQHYAVFEFETDADLGNELHVVFNARDSNVLWPLPGGFCRWSFQLVDSAVDPDSRRKGRIASEPRADRYAILDEELLRPWIQQRAPWFKGSVGEVRWRMAVRFDQRLARSLGRGRVWLVGDAAHVTYPVGAQSMNVAFREGRELADALAAILREGGTMGRLTDYGKRCHNEWRFLTGQTGRVYARPGADPFVCRHVDRLLPCIPASGAQLKQLADQLGVSVVETGETDAPA